MAIYHLSAQIISRAKGRSSVAAAAYRAAEQLQDARTSKTHDFSRKSGVAHREILAPQNAPTWMLDRASLWNGVEAAEKRKDAQVAREVRVALPKELTCSEQVEVLRRYVSEQFVARGMVADVALHHDNPDNPHAHIMLTMRAIDGDSFGAKARAWNAKDVLLEWRSEWTHACNRGLEKAGHDTRVDHRSYRDQGVALEPTVKVGVGEEQKTQDTRDVWQERVAENDEIARRNGEAILANPDVALDAITHQRATFTRSDVGRWLNTHTADAEQFQDCLDRVMGSESLIRLGEDDSGRVRFTTYEMRDTEQKMLACAEALHGKAGRHVVDGDVLHDSLQGLDSEQRQALVHVMTTHDISVVEGYAGAGKSTMMGAARKGWEAQGYRVLGAALSGKAAEGLELSAGIASRSLASLEYAWKQGKEALSAKDVVVIDEAGMVGTRQMGRVLDKAHRAGAKVVLVGDTEQLQAIEAGAPMRVIGARVGGACMANIRRQEEGWQRQASVEFAQGNTKKGLAFYEEKARVHAHDTQAEACAAMTRAWAKHRKLEPWHTQIMLAFRRDEVRQLNEAARNIRKAAGELGADQRVDTARGLRDFAAADRVYFLKNDRQLGVKNGTLGTVEKVRGHEMLVRLDGDDPRQVVLDTRAYNHLDHGYAATVHKAQGVTVDRAHVLTSELYDRHVTYVAMTRHRREVDLHWSRETFGHRGAAAAILGRARPKDMAVDYETVERSNVRLDERLRTGAAQSGPAPKNKTPAQEPLAEKEAREARMTAHYKLQRHYADIERLAKREPLTWEKAWEGRPEVRAALGDADTAKQQLTHWAREQKTFQKAHPVKAKLGLEPFHEIRGRPMILSTLVGEARDAVARTAKRVRELARDPKLIASAKAEAAEHNKRSLNAKKELPELAKAYKAASVQQEKDLAVRAREHRLQREMGRGRGFGMGL